MMAISIYTARVILDVLGVEDYGIYNVVGGVVAMLGFMNASMSGCTQRFISYALGEGNQEKLKATFSTALFIHIIIGIVVVLIAETIGLWFVCQKLVIPEERMSAALWTYHFAIASAFISIISVPYNADIIAHEKMSAFAFIAIYDAIAKLLIVFLLTAIPFDHLKTYALLLFIVQLSDRAIYGYYCQRNFNETHVHWVWDKELFKEMISFSGWDLYGNMSVTVRTQGVNMLLNMFFGPALNAASGIATSVQNVIMGFASNIVTAIRPQVVKSYANKDYQRMNFLLQKGALFTFLLLMMLTSPLIIEIDYVLSIWLVEVPEYAGILCQLTLIFNLFADLSVIVMCGIHATGKIKKSSIINGTLYLAVLPITYVAYKFQYLSPELPFIINVFAVIIGMSLNVYYLYTFCNAFNYKKFYSTIILKCIVSFIISLIVLYSLTLLMEDGIFRLILVCAASVALTGCFVLLLLNKEERRRFLQIIREKIHV